MRKKSFILIILVFLIFIAALFYLYDKNNKDKESKVDPGPKTAYQEVKNFSFEEVVEFVLDNQDKTYNDSQERVDNFNSRDIEIINYLDCMALSENNEEYYIEAENYIKSLDDIDQRIRGDYISYINRKKIIKDQEYYRLIANNQTDVLCENNLLEQKCLDGVVLQDDVAQIHCKEICEYINRATNDDVFFQKAVIEPRWFYNFSKDDPLAYDVMDFKADSRSLYPWRIALAYRVGGADSAHDICYNWFPDNDRQQSGCLSRVNFIIDRFKGNYNCDRLVNVVKSFIKYKSEIKKENN